MGDPRNPARANELWNPVRIKVLLNELDSLKEFCIVSGGWAWHLMSPPHEELKLYHDHKDIDLYVNPKDFSTVVTGLIGSGYAHIWSRFDKVSHGKFYRYEKIVDGAVLSGTVKVLIDLFLQDVPFIEVNGFKIVEPSYLLTLYRKKVHLTDDCSAVIGARKLVEKGINPIGRKELIQKYL